MNETRMTTAEVLDAIARQRERLMRAIDALGSGASTVPVTEEGWTAKDVLAHLTHWATQIAFGLGAKVQPPVYMLEERRRREVAGIDTTTMPTGEESNALAVAHYRDVPIGEVRAGFERLVEAIVERARVRTDEEMNATDAIPFAGARPLWQQIGGDTFLHWPVHAAALERAASQRPD
jgi:hypothetical protein